MKTLMALITLLSISSVLACPNLEGQSSCAQHDLFNDNKEVMGGRVHNIVIEQEKVDENDTYYFQYKDNDENDGVIRPQGTVVVNKKTITNKHDFWTRTDVQHELTAKCQGNSLLINSKVIHNGELVSETNEVLTQLKEKNFKHTIN